MVLTGKLSCLWTVILFPVVSDSSPKIPSITDRKFINQCVRTHNELRGKVSPPAADMKYMTWEAGLAKVAKAWADRCKFEHNSCLSKPYGCHAMFQHIGENIWLGGLRTFSPKFAIESWYSENAVYNFDMLSCSSVCGHYTQVVWATSKKVGCAISLCPNLGIGQTSIFVCNYAPPGNYPNTPPYTKGTPCSMCEVNDTCENNLCSGAAAKWNSASQCIVYTAMCLIYNLLRVF
ncbi:GLIPR1-like protein 1 [Talpa occidentalis]|uniref:GLIPR1-like protein 1 n=1 Tax=Talpa occidentalis TaxID=50954 RepID=UPI00189079E6|nr:GLIPR1-like protein 1 [Talpa occidentalis]